MLFLKNKTKNQHFISRSEQKFNSLDTDKNKIYRFEKLHERSIKEIKCVSIKNNLSKDDLFTFKIGNDKDRFNFEFFYIQYEQDIHKWTMQLLDKIDQQHADITDEIYQIFVFKLMNFIRNPYNVKKVINTFKSTLSYIPTSEKYKEINEELKKINEDDQQKICMEFGISLEEYREWLLINLLTIGAKSEDGVNLLYLLTQSLFDPVNMIIDIKLFKYSQKSVLLADRGFIELCRDVDLFNFSINLTKRVFISYTFISKKHRKDIWNNLSFKNIDVDIIEDDFRILNKYNSFVVNQSCKFFYCSENNVVCNYEVG